MFKKLSFVTVATTTIWCAVMWVRGIPPVWPVVFIGLIPAVINLAHDCIIQWEREQLEQILKENGMMEEIESLAHRDARRLTEILEDEDNKEED